MQVLALLLSWWLAIQNYSEGCTLSLCPPCHYGCVVKCNHIDCLGADCSGFRKCHEECPAGTFPMLTKPCKHVFIFCIRSNDITQNHILLVVSIVYFDNGY